MFLDHATRAIVGDKRGWYGFTWRLRSSREPDERVLDTRHAHDCDRNINGRYCDSVRACELVLSRTLLRTNP